LFNGQKTSEIPFPEKGNFTFDSNGLAAKMVNIGEGISIQSSFLPDDLFGTATDGNNFFKTLESMNASLEAGTSIDLSDIDKGMARILTAAAENVARQDRVEAVENRMLDSSLQLIPMLSNVDDIVYAEAIIKLTSEESVYQASRAATSR